MSTTSRAVALTAAQREAMVADARNTLVRALDRLNEVAASGAYPEALVVVFAMRESGQESTEGEPMIREGCGWESNGVPSWAAAGLLRQVARRIERGP